MIESSMKKFNSNHLKLIAIVAMNSRSIADLFYPGCLTVISNILHVIVVNCSLLCFSLFVRAFSIQKI